MIDQKFLEGISVTADEAYNLIAQGEQKELGFTDSAIDTAYLQRRIHQTAPLELQSGGAVFFFICYYRNVLMIIKNDEWAITLIVSL